ncbi:MAG TPA: hypothetical protein VMF59_02930 [Bacteroidota bacterium]|nr:hypothetical protein [Bacteroidota bacterium]
MNTTAVMCACEMLAVLCWCGCSVEETIAIDHIDASGPQSSPPIHITNDSVNAVRAAIHISPRSNHGLSATFTNPGSTTSGSRVIPSTSGTLHWSLPPVVGGVDLDVPLSHSVALTGGVNVSDNLVGYNAGIGFSDNEENATVRLDLGFQWQSLSYDADYTLTTTISSMFGESTDIQKLHKSATGKHGDFYGSLTVNSKRPPGALNFFFQVGYVHQTIFDIREQTIVFPFFGWSDNVALTSSCVTLTPGFSIDISRSFRIVAGARCLLVVDPDSSDPTFSASPVLLFDFGL